MNRENEVYLDERSEFARSLIPILVTASIHSHQSTRDQT